MLETPRDLQSQRKLTFELGAKYHIRKRYEELGGCAANVAGGLAKLGLEAECYTVIGDDLAGRWILEKLARLGIGRKFVRVERKCPSDLSAIIVDEKTGDRVIFSNQYANSRLKVENEKIKNVQMVFIGDLSGNWQKNLEMIVASATKRKIALAFNPRQKTIHDDAKKIARTFAFCEIVFLNKDEAIEIVMSQRKKTAAKLIKDEIFLLRELKKTGVGKIIITDGKRGAWVFDGQKILQAQATENEPVETTGAGDAFASGFLASYLKGNNLTDCLKWGIVNSGNSVNFFGAHRGLLNEKEMLKKSEKLKVIHL